MSDIFEDDDMILESDYVELTVEDELDYFLMFLTLEQVWKKFECKSFMDAYKQLLGGGSVDTAVYEKAFEVLQQHGLLSYDRNSGELSVTEKGREVERELLAELGYASMDELIAEMEKTEEKSGLLEGIFHVLDILESLAKKANDRWPTLIKIFTKAVEVIV